MQKVTIRNPISLGRLFKKRRKAIGWSLDRVANLTGYSRAHINYIEEGRYFRANTPKYSLACALTIAKCLNIPFSRVSISLRSYGKRN